MFLYLLNYRQRVDIRVDNELQELKPSDNYRPGTACSKAGVRLESPGYCSYWQAHVVSYKPVQWRALVMPSPRIFSITNRG